MDRPECGGIVGAMTLTIGRGRTIDRPPKGTCEVIGPPVPCRTKTSPLQGFGPRPARHAKDRDQTPAADMIGSRVTGWPVRRRQALATAGPIGGVPGSPTPVGAALDSIIATSTCGISEMRSER